MYADVSPGAWGPGGRAVAEGAPAAGACRTHLSAGGVVDSRIDAAWPLPAGRVAIRALEVGLAVQRVIGYGRCDP